MNTYNYIHLFDHTREWGDPKCCRFFRLHWNNDLAGLVTEMAKDNGTTPDNIRMFIYPTREQWQKQIDNWHAIMEKSPILEERYRQAVREAHFMADRCQCIFEHKIYQDYKWFEIAFMTDRFGGIASIVKFYDGKWDVDGQELPAETPLDKVLGGVPAAVEALRKSRDLAAVSELINAENED